MLKKKLIEVALPLEAINVASAREKSIRHGHPSTLHLWWARRPLAAARAVIFAQMVDDPSEHTDLLLSDPAKKRAAKSELKKRQELWELRNTKHEEAQAREDNSVAPPGAKPALAQCAADIERERLFEIIRELVKWENTTNETVLQQARDEIWQSWRYTCAENAAHPRAKELFDRHKLPAFHDPFAGGGSLPLEAQRLGLEAYASDLNPVAVLINKAMIEIPSNFAGQPPVNPQARGDKQLFTKKWKGAHGLADDVRYYGQWMRNEAEKRIGHFYPQIDITPEMAATRSDLNRYVGSKVTVIAWIWARTVESPNPALSGILVPLVTTFLLSNKAGKEAYIEPLLDGKEYRFVVRTGKPDNIAKLAKGTKTARGANFQCLISGEPIPETYVKAQTLAGKAGTRLLAIVAEGSKERIYISANEAHEAIAFAAKPIWSPSEDICYDPHSGATWCVLYGLKKFEDLFTKRQLVALAEFSELVEAAREKVMQDAHRSGSDRADMSTGQSESYANAVAVYLALSVGRSANYWSSLTPWGGDFIVQTFSRQALPMVWDFAEGNPFSDSTGNWTGALEWIANVIENALPATPKGHALQSDAQNQTTSTDRIVSTDPPYFDNIGYADLSDYFYVWLRHALKTTLPDLFATVTVPKAEELISAPTRQGSKEKAELFFLTGMTEAMHRLAERAHAGFPVTIYYAFKQAEKQGIDGLASTGWETFLEAVIQAGFGITGTWPIRTERSGGFRNKDQNALASSIILVCRQRSPSPPTATRREFVTALKAELPVALIHLQRGNIAPVDLAQAAIGPGMGVYTRYAKVVDAEGRPLSVRDALTLINHTLDEALAEQEGDFDADSRWALAWFEQSGFADGEYGVAETLSTAKNTSVEGMKQAGILVSKGGKVRLLKPSELPADWDPATDPRLTAWEMVHHLIRTLEAGGESAAATLVAQLGAKAEIARELAYRLYTLCERKKRAAEALSYNALVQSWPEIVRLSREEGKPAAQATMAFGDEE